MFTHIPWGLVRMRTSAQQVWGGRGAVTWAWAFPTHLWWNWQEAVRPFVGRDAGAAASGGTNAHPTPWRFQGDHSARRHGRWPQEMDLISPSHLAEASLPASAIVSLPEQRLTGGLDWRAWVTWLFPAAREAGKPTSSFHPKKWDSQWGKHILRRKVSQSGAAQHPSQLLPQPDTCNKTHRPLLRLSFSHAPGPHSGS